MKEGNMVFITAILPAILTAVSGNEAAVSVHEWGVVVFSQESGLNCGGPWQQSPNYPGTAPAEAFAPVVWIYGESFSGTFSVVVGEGQAIGFVHPAPDVTEAQRVEWNISAGRMENQAESIIFRWATYGGPFNWAADFWRAVPSLPLLMESSGIIENFLYYDCTVEPEFTDHFFIWDSHGRPVFESYLLEDALYFSGAGAPDPIIWRNGAFIPLNTLYRPEIERNTLSEWAGARLYDEEVTALWETWQPVFTEEGTEWLLFPIPDEYVDEISCIALSTDNEEPAEYRRFYLGAVKLSQP